MGVFGTFVSCLDNSIKKSISESLKLNQSFDSDRKLTQGIIFLLKGLRNSIAHNDVIYDTRFQTSKPSRALKRCLEADTGISDISFNTIVDYFILVIYMLKCFDVTKTELKKIVKSFELGINSFRQKIPISIYSSIFYSDTRNKLNLLKAFV
jgi:abortive infection bacteriophage resistance protein